MKTIICGGRGFAFGFREYDALQRLRPVITEVVSGGATGADAYGEFWARDHHIPCRVFGADWGKGLGAGPARNEQMAHYAQVCIAFPGNAGTADMVQRAKAHGLVVLDWRNGGYDTSALDLL